MNFWGFINLKVVFDVLFAAGFGLLFFARVKEKRTLWLLRGYLFLVSLAWFVQRYANLPLTSKLIDAVVLACSLSLAILWQGELRRLMELLGTGRLTVLLGNPPKEFRANGNSELIQKRETPEDLLRFDVLPDRFISHSSVS